MHNLITSRRTYYGLAVILITIALLMIHGVGSQNKTALITTTADIGTVRQLVSVSGATDAKQLAELAFPTGGIVDSVQVDVGDEVQKGDLLITLDARTLYADRQAAVAALAEAVASRDELLQGPTATTRSVTAEALQAKREALITTRATEAQKVANAYHALLSTGLTAYSNDPNEDATAPTLSSTYICDTEGTYTLTLFNSAADSGYSYQLSGLETGIYTASVEQPTPLGICGLRILFDNTSVYNRSVWHIDIPNTKSASYVTYKNTYDLAVAQADSAVALAEQAVALAEADAQNQNAPARKEAVDRANAVVAEAKARLSRIDATLADRTLTAPFAGTITDIDLLPGETVGTNPVITLLAKGTYKLIARVPEIDISKLVVGQTAEIVFDTQPAETILGDISFISPQSTEIDGVAYYETTILFRDTPTWMRSGLNADVDIVTNETTGNIRIPKRFITTTEAGSVVKVLKNGVTASTTVEVLMTGNDGYVAVTGINEGDTLVAP